MSKEKERMKFDILPYAKEDFEELKGLYFDCFESEIDLDYFHWKFLNNPAGQAVGFIARHEGNLAGFYGVIPERYSVDGKGRIIYQSMDTMTSPNYRRKGLFTTLANATYQSLIDKFGEVYIIGFPGITSYPGFVKRLGWKDVMQVKYYFANKLTFKIKNVFKKHQNLDPRVKSELGENISEYFKTKEGSAKRIQKEINREFINWRCFSKHTKQFHLLEFYLDERQVGFVIYRYEGKDRCFIHYVDAIEEKYKADILYNFNKYIFDVTETSYIFVFEPTDNKLNKIAKQTGFIYNPFKKGMFSFRPAVILYSNKDSIEKVPFFAFENFDLQGILRDY